MFPLKPFPCGKEWGHASPPSFLSHPYHTFIFSTWLMPSALLQFLQDPPRGASCRTLLVGRRNAEWRQASYKGINSTASSGRLNSMRRSSASLYCSRPDANRSWRHWLMITMDHAAASRVVLAAVATLTQRLCLSVYQWDIFWTNCSTAKQALHGAGHLGAAVWLAPSRDTITVTRVRILRVRLPLEGLNYAKFKFTR